jgi:SAM-dependent methyltransferase
MGNELLILRENKLKTLYNNNSCTIKSICEDLGIWNTYSKDEKYKLENLTLEDSKINRHFTYKGEYDINLRYFEVLCKGVDTIIEKINKYKKITKKDVFVDVGCGSGKLVLHMAISTDFRTLIGVDIVKERVEYAKYIRSKILPIEEKGVFFVNKDILDFDLSVASFIFINNIYFDFNLFSCIYDKIPSGCHFLSATEVKDVKIFKEKFNVDVSPDRKMSLYYYIKN